MLKSKFIKALSLTGAILFVQTAWATPPSDELIEQYLKVSRKTERIMEHIYAGFRDGSKTKMLREIKEERPNLNLILQKEEMLEIVIDEFVQDLSQLVIYHNFVQESILSQIIETSKKHCTAEELQNLISFYSTPLGYTFTHKHYLKDSCIDFNFDPKFDEGLLDKVYENTIPETISIYNTFESKVEKMIIQFQNKK